VARLQTLPEIHASIVAGFRDRPRWAGLYTMYAAARRRRGCCFCCFRGVVDQMVRDRELLIFAGGPPDFDRYLWHGVQSTARAACARAELEAIREGGTT
jgi:hypothetical protein